MIPPSTGILNHVLCNSLYSAKVATRFFYFFLPLLIMKKQFTLGAIAGATSLLLAVPLFAQMSSAESSPSVMAAKTRPVPTQACILAMADHETTMLGTMDAMIATHKAAATAKRDALKAAAALTDDTARMEALKKAQESFRTAMETTMQAKDKTAMDALKTACGDAGMGFGGHMKMGAGPQGKNGHFGMMKQGKGMGAKASPTISQ